LYEPEKVMSYMALPFQLPHGPVLGKPQTTGVGLVPAKIPGSERLRDEFK